MFMSRKVASGNLWIPLRDLISGSRKAFQLGGVAMPFAFLTFFDHMELKAKGKRSV